eukprot:TRINITY_DN6783_c0_g2_i1.p1 TRINITY_DN6783_c0_g2~~TRINITY_DN6783_c0_g2_i1.p1  ORF type:complete len:167 (+),score=60.22 TRINITY_DN6783_c0_g2_i1:71-502(+)
MSIRVEGSQETLVTMKFEQMLAGMPDMPQKMKDQMLLNQVNKYTDKPGRWCGYCDKKYDLKGDEKDSPDQVKMEQWLSGLCSQECFYAIQGGIENSKHNVGDTADECEIKINEKGIVESVTTKLGGEETVIEANKDINNPTTE